jgi:hypothetical protein
MPIQLPKPVVVQNQKFKLLAYGDAGIGKSTLAATAAQHPDMSPVLFLNLEGGLLSVAGQPGVDEVKISNSAEMDEAYFALAKRQNGFGHYKTIVIDSGTVFANRVLIEWAQRNALRAQRKGRGDPDRTIDDIQLEDYGKMTAQIRRTLSWFYDLPYHVICTALAKTVYPPVEKGTNLANIPPAEIRPDFTDKLGNQVMGIFDHVWYVYQDEDENRYALTRRSGIYHAKTRGRHFNEEIGGIVGPNPNLADLYSTLVRVEGNVDTDDAPALPVADEETPPIE